MGEKTPITSCTSSETEAEPFTPLLKRLQKVQFIIIHYFSFMFSIQSFNAKRFCSFFDSSKTSQTSQMSQGVFVKKVYAMA